MPAGVPRADYIRLLADALGLRRQKQKLRDILKEGGVFPYKGQEHRALELLVQKGYREQLKKYRPIAPDAQLYLDRVLNGGASSPSKKPPTESIGRNQELALLPSPSPPKTAQKAWDHKLTPRLARLLARSYPNMDIEVLKRMARKIMRDGGMEARSEDESRALAIFQAAGYSIEGFEYGNALPVASEPTIETAQLPADLEGLSPQQLRLEIVNLRQRIKHSGLMQHRLVQHNARVNHLLRSAENLWEIDRAKLITDNPNIRPPRITERDHMWLLALLESERSHPEDET